jgi:hypothetical protein
MQSHEIADVPQVFAAHWAMTAPPATTTQICPGTQVRDEGFGHTTLVHGPLESDQRAAAALPATQVATVRPAPAQSS